MKYETKFKYNDKVQVIVTPEVQGELIDIRPKYLQDGVPVYTYIMFTPRGFMEVREIDITKINKYNWEEE